MDVVCFPHAGAGRSAYRTFVGAFPASTTVRAVQLPGREQDFNKPLVHRLTEAVDYVVGTVQVNGPTIFFGHSLGALLAFEVARALPARGMAGPVGLVVSGHKAPNMPSRHAATYHLDDAAFIDAIFELEGPNEALQHPELRELALPILRADCEIVQTYRYEDDTPLAIPVLVLGGSDDASTTDAELRGWKHLTTDRVEVRIVPGGHFFPFERTQETVGHVVDFFGI